MDITPIEVVRGDVCVACRNYYEIGTPVWIETEHLNNDVVARLRFVLCGECSKKHCGNSIKRRLLWTSDRPLSFTKGGS